MRHGRGIFVVVSALIAALAATSYPVAAEEWPLPDESLNCPEGYELYLDHYAAEFCAPEGQVPIYGDENGDGECDFGWVLVSVANEAGEILAAGCVLVYEQLPDDVYPELDGTCRFGYPADRGDGTIVCQGYQPLSDGSCPGGGWIVEFEGALYCQFVQAAPQEPEPTAPYDPNGDGVYVIDWQTGACSDPGYIIDGAWNDCIALDSSQPPAADQPVTDDATTQVGATDTVVVTTLPVAGSGAAAPASSRLHQEAEEDRSKDDRPLPPWGWVPLGLVMAVMVPAAFAPLILRGRHPSELDCNAQSK